MSNDDPTRKLPDNDEPTKIFRAEEPLQLLVQLVQAQGEQIAEMRVEMSAMRAELSALRQKVDERLYDTRPLWEAVHSQIAELKGDLDKGLRTVALRLDVVSVDINKVRADMINHESRLDRLEHEPEPS